MNQNRAVQSRGSSKNDNKHPIGDWFRSQFHMRPADDDEPQTTGPVANSMSIIALVSPWKNSIKSGQLSQDSIPIQIGYLGGEDDAGMLNKI